MADSLSPVMHAAPSVTPQLLSCGICLGHYTRPKVLPCFHTFCEQCLYAYIPAESLSISCPICRQQSILPIEGVSGLQNNVFIVNIMDVISGSNLCAACDHQVAAACKCADCDILLCETCADLHDGNELTSEHNVVSISELTVTESCHESKLVCPNHDGKQLRYYCCPCETAVCEDCTALEHNEHRTVLLKDAIQEQKTALETLISGARSRLPLIKESIVNVENVSELLTDRSRRTQEQISNTFDTLCRIMSERKSTLLTQLESLYTNKHKTLLDQKDALESILNRINSSCNFTEETLERGSETEILMIKKEMGEKLAELSEIRFQCQPEENEYIHFDHTSFHSLKKCIHNFGNCQTNSAIAFETTASGEGVKHCYVGRPTVVSVNTKDHKGDLIKIGSASLMALLTAGNGDTIEPLIADNKNGTYDITYMVRDEGFYVMDMKLYGLPIKGSPFKIKAIPGGEELDQLGTTGKTLRTTVVKQKGTKRPSSSRSHGSNRRSNPIEDDLMMRIGTKGRNKGEFSNPQGICVAPNGRILVADSNNQVVQVFMPTGEAKMKFGTPGRLAGKMQRPTGIGITLNGNYLIADYDNKWVSVFSPDGKYINKLGTGKLLGPKGIAVDRNGHIIVVDNKASSILIFQSNGKLIQKFGSRGNEEHQFAGPHYAAVNTSGDIIVSDFHNHCIKVFNSEGGFLYTFGSNGEGNGQFNAPTGVAVDELGNILVADWGNSRIQVFDSSGSFLSYINTSTDPLYGPQGLAISPEGNVVVADSGNHCFKVYKYLQ